MQPDPIEEYARPGDGAHFSVRNTYVQCNCCKMDDMRAFVSLGVEIVRVCRMCDYRPPRPEKAETL